MPPNPTMPTSRAIHTWRLASALSSLRMLTSLPTGCGGDPGPDRDQGSSAEGADSQERATASRTFCPSSVVSGTPTMLRHRRPIMHHRDRPGPPVGRHHRGADQGADAEERAVRQAGQEPGQPSAAVAVRDEAESDVGERRRPPSARAAAVCGAVRAPSAAITGAPTTTPIAYAETSARRSGWRCAGAGGDLGQQAHRDELGGPDRETTDCQGQQRQPDMSRSRIVRSH